MDAAAKPRIYVIISEEPVYHPVLMRNLVAALSPSYAIVGCTLAIGDTRRISSAQRFAEIIGMLGVMNAGLLVLQRVLFSLGDLLGRGGESPYSVRRVVTAHGIPCVTSHNVNEPEHIEHLRSLDIDVIVSSNGHIFKDDLLGVPRRGCINRHTSLLPAYGGLWPVFWAMLHDEATVGQTIHTMTAKIDEGLILAQEEIPVQDGDTMLGLYAKAVMSAPALIREAIDNLISGDTREMPREGRSYFSHPGRAEGKQFRRTHRFFRCGELFRRVSTS